MEETVAYHAQTTADTKPVTFRMELVLNVKMDIKEQFVQRVFLFFFNWEIYIKTFLSLIYWLIFVQGFCKKRSMLTESLSPPFTVGVCRSLSVDRLS